MRIKDTNISHLTSVINKLEEMGVRCIKGNDYIDVSSNKRLECTDINTLPYPGFPTDMQPIISVLLMCSKGMSIITENIFENRFKYALELKRMGAKLIIKDRNLIITGIRRYHASSVDATDLRGGAAMVLAGLNARGKTRVNNIKYILRGYDALDKKLNALGANIELKEGE